jgi:uridine phosphorylase
MEKYFPPSELVLNDLGQVYHLCLLPEDISNKIILVGDPGRVEFVASFFEKILFKKSHREFLTVTGVYKGTTISVISTGIGTDNMDIVLNELDALFNIDLNTRKVKESLTKLEIIRIGTCGLIQKEREIHSYILSTGAIGLDNVAHFYPMNYNDNEKDYLSNFVNFFSFPKQISPYFVEASDKMISKFDSENLVKGITVTASGFYGPQGRSLRLGLEINDLNEKLERFSFHETRIENFEMETSALFALGKGLGHDCVTICLGIANRPANTFSKAYEKEMKGLINYVLNKF